MISKKIKLGVFGAIFCIASTLSIALPLVLQKNKQLDDFKPIVFDNQIFSSKSEVLNYINKNSDQIEKEMGEEIYTVSEGNDKFDFDQYEKAYDYVNKNLSESEVYLKPDAPIDQELDIIDPTIFVKKEDTIKYYIFAKFSGNNEKHSYTYARADASEEEIIKARNEAIASYIQVHSAFLFNDIYFNTINDVRSYIVANWSNIPSFDANKKGTYKTLMLEGNRMITFDSNQNLENLKNDDKFREQVMQHATPYYPFGDDFVEVSYQNINSLSSIYSEKDLPYIVINSNNNEVTQIVDMDSSTPNGNIYGAYYVQSALSMNKITDVSNWNQVNSNTDLPSNEIIDVSMLKSIINYLIKSEGLSSIYDFLNLTTLPENDLSFAEYLESAFPTFNYLQASYNLINNLAKGVRNNHLDNIIALHSYLINLMIQRREDASKIINVARYFDVMMQILDDMLEVFLAPLLGYDKNNQVVSASNYNINYFQSAFKFYDETAPGKGINFQDNPYSYYRRLLGYIEYDSNGGVSNLDASKERETIFYLIQSMMGVHAISMKAIRHNQEVYYNWADEYYEQYSKNYAKWQNNIEYWEANGGDEDILKDDIKELDFWTEENNWHLWDFTFNMPGSESKDARNSIWNNLESITNPLIFGNQVINRDQMWENMINYLKEIQNPAIALYRKKFLASVNDIRKMYEDTKYAESGRNSLKNALNINTIEFININTSDIDDSQITTGDKYRHLENMINNAMVSLRDRMKNLATTIGTLATQAVIAAASAGAGAEVTMIESGIAKANIKSSASKISMSNNKFLFTERSSSYEATYNWTKKIRIEEKGDSFYKQIKSKIDVNGLTNNQVYNAQLAISNYFASWFTTDDVELNQLISDIFEVAIRITTNVFPFLGKLFGLIDSFESYDKQIYSFSQLEDGSKIYWDGSLVHYSWWGFAAEQLFSIKDLKMIDPIEIISGYSGSEEGFYYNNNIYSDLAELKYKEAKRLVTKILTSNRLEMLSNDNQTDMDLKNIYWAINIADLETVGSSNANKYFQNINDLVEYAAKYGVSEISKEKWKTSSGLETADLNVVQEELLDATINKLKNILILRLPDFKNGFPESPKKFTLPYPQYFAGKVIYGPNNNSLNDIFYQANYIIFNPNINLEKISESFTSNGLNQNQNHQKIIQLLDSIASQDYEGTKEKMNLLIKNYVKNIAVPEKTVIFQELNDFRNKYFEDFNDQWTKTSKTIYYFKNTKGNTLYFLEKTSALKQLFGKDNYNLDTTKLGRISIVYKFKGILFNSLDKIYQYIINNQEGANNEENLTE